MSIDEKIREVASRALPSWTFVFDDWYGADKSITKVDLPVVLNILPVAGTLAERNGMIRNAQSCAARRTLEVGVLGIFSFIYFFRKLGSKNQKFFSFIRTLIHVF